MDVGSGGRGLRGPISEGMVRPSFCFLTSRRSSRGGGSSSAANADDPLRTWTSVRTSARAPPYASLGLEQADSRPCYTPSGPRRSCAGGVFRQPHHRIGDAAAVSESASEGERASKGPSMGGEPMCAPRVGGGAGRGAHLESRPQRGRVGAAKFQRLLQTPSCERLEPPRIGLPVGASRRLKPGLLLYLSRRLHRAAQHALFLLRGQ